MDPAAAHRARGARLFGRLRGARSHPAGGFCDGRTRIAAGSLGGLLRLVGALAGVVILLLADARSLAAATAQVIELGAAHLAAAHELDRVDHGRIERKDALHAFAIGNLAHGEILVEARARAADANALISLDAGAVALDHFDVDEDRVARREIRDFLAGGKLRDLLFLELVNQIHGNSPAAARISESARSYRLCGSGELLRHRRPFVTHPGGASCWAVCWAWARRRRPHGPPTDPGGVRG